MKKVIKRSRRFGLTTDNLILNRLNAAVQEFFEQYGFYPTKEEYEAQKAKLTKEVASLINSKQNV